MATVSSGRRPDINALVYFLLLILNIAPFLGITALSVEFPLLVNRVPEAWDLPSYVVVIVNSTKILAFLYSVLQHFCKGRIPETPFLFVIIFGVGASIFCLAFVWDTTVRIGADDHSIPMLVLMGMTSVLASLSLVVFLAYMAHYNSRYISAYFVGNGVSRVLLASAGMVQGVGERPECINQTLTVLNESLPYNTSFGTRIAVYPEPNFSVGVFFIMVSGLACFSGVAFTLLQYHPYCKNRRQPSTTAKNTHDTGPDSKELQSLNKPRETDQAADKSNNLQDDMKAEHELAETIILTDGSTKDSHPSQPKATCTRSFIILNLAVAWNDCLWYAVIPTVAPYAALPYGNRAYSLAVKLGLVTSPLAAFVTLFLSPRSYVVFGVLGMTSAICTGYLVTLAAFSPNPPLIGTATGEAMAVSRVSALFSELVFHVSSQFNF